MEAAMQLLPELELYQSFCEKLQEKIRLGNAAYITLEKEMEENPPLIFSEVIDCDADLIVCHAFVNIRKRSS
jgi:hypothetical protein